jgi:O-antigen/teichoic acid export membrane protein
MSNIATNSLWNLAAFTFGVAANLLTIPFVLSHIGIHAFGTATLIQALVAPLAVVGISLGQATAQGLAARNANGRDLLATAGLIGLVCTAIGVFVLATGGKIIATTLFKIDAHSQQQLVPVFVLSAFGWAATVGTGILQSIYVSSQKYSRISQINAFGAICTAASIFVLVSMRPTIASYILALNIGFLSIFIAYLFFATKEHRHLLTFPAWHPRAAKIMSSFGGWQIAAQASGIAATQTDRYLLGAFVQSEAVAWYSIAQRLQEVAYIGVYKMGEVVFPVFGAEAMSSLERRADLFARVSWILNTLAACALGSVMALAHGILLVWTGKSVADNGSGVLSILSLAGLVGSGANALNFYLLGTGRPQVNFIVALLTAIVSCCVSALLLPHFGLSAAGYGALTAMCAQIVTVIIIVKSSFGSNLPMSRIFSVICMPLTIGIGLGFSFRFVGLPPPSGWLTLCLQFALVAATIGTICLLSAALTADGRRSLGDVRRIALKFTGMGV